MKFSQNRGIYINDTHRNKILEMCDNLLPNKNRGNDCIYTFEHYNVICKYDLHNNFGSREGNGINWLELCTVHFFDIMNLKDSDKLSFLNSLKEHSENRDKLHPIEFIYSKYEEYSRNKKIDNILK